VRLDATNVIDPILSILTTIGYDHKFLLGESIEQIAYEKAGIIKKQRPVIIEAQHFPQVTQVIINTARSFNSSLFFADNTVKILKRKIYPNKQELAVSIDEGELAVETYMLGEHQVKNIQTALTAVVLLRESGINISDSAIIQGIKNWYIPGRIEVLRRDPLIVVDGAHCPLSMKALLETIKDIANPQRCIFLIAVMKDKDILPFFELIKQERPDSIIFTHPAPTPRTLHPERVSAIAKSIGLNTRAFDSTESALQSVSTLLKTGGADAFIACGTFYCIAQVKHLVNAIFK